jgi:hypothetical protein
MFAGEAAPLGSTIKLYLADGTPGGIRVLEKDNWSGIGIDCSRKDLARARTREEFAGSGIYILTDFDDESGGLPHIYIGEAEDLGERLGAHAKKDDFGWGRLVIFTSKDSSINKAHAKYIEARLFQLAVAVKRGVLKNKNTPKPPKLSESDADHAETFVREALIILPVIGISEFETPPSAVKADELRFELVGSGTASGFGVETADGFKVFKGAIASIEAQPSTSNATKQLREDLSKNGAIEPYDGALRLAQDYVFNSPSLAASVLCGWSINGRTAWRLSDGRTLKQVQEEQIESQAVDSPEA